MFWLEAQELFQSRYLESGSHSNFWNTGLKKQLAEKEAEGCSERRCIYRSMAHKNLQFLGSARSSFW